jgi:hypothetical protein
MLFEPNLEQIRRNYEGYDDQTLLHLATEQASKLRPEALNLLMEVLQSRGLVIPALQDADSVINEIGENTFSAYLELIRTLPCPVCASNTKKLNAIFSFRVKSFFIKSIRNKKLHISCPDCLLQQLKKDTIYTLLYGWWSLPTGLMLTIKTLFFNSKTKKQLRGESASKALNTFVLERIGLISQKKDKAFELQEMIKNL